MTLEEIQDVMGWAALVVAALLVVGLVIIGIRYFGLWLRAFVTRTRIGLPSLVFMSLRKINPRVIVDAKVLTVQAGLSDLSSTAMEAHYLAGGDVMRVALALIAADRARIELDWDTAAAIDLAGRNILEAVQVSVNPKVIDCPEPGRGRGNTLDGVAKDGIQLKVRVRVTVRTNLQQLIGGATESTVIARIGEGIVSVIGSCDNYNVALANPLLISRRVMEKGLDLQTAFAILSIDIANIEVGDNIGARLQIDQAEADIRIARAKAEERRSMAVAREQEMKALTQENRARVVLAAAEVPRAVADAFRTGCMRVSAAQHDTSAGSRTGYQFARLAHVAAGGEQAPGGGNGGKVRE